MAAQRKWEEMPGIAKAKFRAEWQRKGMDLTSIASAKRGDVKRSMEMAEQRAGAQGI